MKNIDINSSLSFTEVVDCLNKGGVCLIPTDTVFGLCCLPIYREAVNKIFALKKRKNDFNLPVMIGDTSQLSSLGIDVNEAAMKLIKSQYFPGPLTIVFGFDSLLERPFWLKNREEVAVRIPDDKFLQDIMMEVGPILMTSANMHQSKDVHYTVNPIIEELNGIPDLVIEGKRQTFEASSIVNVRYFPPQIEREGEVPSILINQILKNEQ